MILCMSTAITFLCYMSVSFPLDNKARIKELKSWKVSSLDSQWVRGNTIVKEFTVFSAHADNVFDTQLCSEISISEFSISCLYIKLN